MKKTIIWRLKEQPKSESLRELVSSGILTKEEAREILFSEVSDEEVKEGRDIESLKSEIKFLREVVEKLSQENRTRVVEIIREVQQPWITTTTPRWYKPYEIWCGNTPSTTSNFSNIVTF